MRLVEDYRAELRDQSRPFVLLSGALILTVYPSWTVVDFFFLPAIARTFLLVRLLTTIPVLIAYLWVVLRPPRGQICEWIGWMNLFLVELSLAWMIPRTGQVLETYLLGFTLPLFGSAMLARWPRSLSILFFSMSLSALAVFFVLSDFVWTPGLKMRVGFYLVSSLFIGGMAALYRYSEGLRDFETRNALRLERERADLLAQEMTRISRIDPLTGLANRRLWDEVSRSLFAVSRRGRLSLAIMVIDIDWFKAINDRFGHPAGDAVLRWLSRMVTRRMRSSDVAARLGGDELAIICPAATPEGATRLAEELRGAAMAMTLPEYPGLRITLSIGVAVLEDDDVTVLDLVKRADQRLYEAKQTRNSVRVDSVEPLPSS